ncbi:MAG: hypothetical protein LBL45_05115 [Treponema sp.]|nr:hypothetical protein [Treponema sp.]
MFAPLSIVILPVMFIFPVLMKKGEAILLTDNQGNEGFLRVREYIADNPVRAGLVEQAAEWMFGSLYYSPHRTTRLLGESNTV